MEKTEKKVLTPEIADLELPLQNIMQKFLPHVAERSYDVIMCEGTSARIPGLIIGNIFNHFAAAKQLVTPEVCFVDIIRSWTLKLVHQDKIDKVLDGKNQCLILTEFISSGRSIDCVGSLIEKFKIPYDVMAIYAKHPEEYYREIGILNPESLYFNGFTYREVDLLRCDLYDRELAPPIYNRNFKPYSERIFLSMEEIPEDRREYMAQIRQDIDVLSERIAI